MKCQKCGINIPDDKLYCERCGTAVQMVPDYNPEEDFSIGKDESGEDRPEEAKPGSRWSRRLKYAALGLFLLVIGRVAWQGAYNYVQPEEEAMAKTEEETEDLLPPSGPKFGILPGKYNYAPLMSISHEGKEQGAIYYTTNGTTPGVQSNVYEAPFEIGEGTMIIRAVFIRADGVQSEEINGTYEVVFDLPEEPQPDIPGGTYENSFYVKLTTEDNCSIYYTTNGEEPDVRSRRYSGPIYIPSGLTVLQAVSVDADGEMSGIVEAIYNVSEISVPQSADLDNFGEDTGTIP